MKSCQAKPCPRDPEIIDERALPGYGGHLMGKAIGGNCGGATGREPDNPWIGPDDAGQTTRIRIATPSLQWERLRCILDLSFDYYWELDRDLRVSQIWHTDPSERRHARGLLLGKARWEVGGAPVDSTWDNHKATLEAHEDFDNFVVRWASETGEVYFLRYAGKARFDGGGEFTGYMGITQDVTEAVFRSRLDSLELTVAKELIHTEISRKALTVVLSAFCDTFAWKVGRFWKPSGSGTQLQLYASTNAQDFRKRDGRLRQGPTLAAPDSDVARIWAVRAASGISSAENGLIVLDQASRSRIIVPLSSDHESFGLLEFVLLEKIRLRQDWSVQILRIADHICTALEREKTLRLLRQSEERFASTVELAALGICHVGIDGKLIHVNRQMSAMLGYSKDELVGMSVHDISHPDDIAESEELRLRLLRLELKTFKVEKRYIRKDGKPLWVRINAVMKLGDDGEPLHNISIVEDISENKSAEARIAHLATHDELTALPNKAMFGQIVSERLDRARFDEPDHCAVLFIDLDRFKSINDSVGHQAGDAVLKAVAVRIRSGIRASDRLARFGGDEFIVLLDEIKNAAEAKTVAEEILRSLQQPLTVDGRQFRVTGSIGVAVYPEDGEDVQTLLRHADMAMYAAKEDGRNEVRRFQGDMGTTSIQRVTLDVYLARGIEREEFLLQYQPRVDAITGKLVGAEALMRWWNRELGTISPAQFIPAAEDSGLIIPLGRWAIERACEQAARWRHASGEDVFVSVNLSPRQFRDGDLLRLISHALESAGLPPELLELEITESAVIADLDGAVRIANSIREMGVSLALDDFGTGYSALAQLRRIPLDSIKIDRSFIRDIATSSQDRAITAAIVAMARELKIAVVAEGVETPEQHTILCELRCDQLQGYYFGEPSHPDELTRTLRMSRGADSFRPTVS